MKRLRFSAVSAVVTIGALLFTGTVVLSQSQYPSNLLEQKGSFSAGAARALGQPFRGVATSAGIVEGLLPIRTTGD